ncbi:MAG: orotate phosphoribosyltransferase [Parvibaculum sp.]|uniref:orotate phosphoribosyltransferase n=1 Tax=Parvibaculum sp. TaxID=2024848 RepID=UPI0025D2C5BC|nr:orotate phosphoribosyltransferase [Parvibaculum sp.]MCE9648897.1 orotate phosphoribosyltransferase [Parvibaculum sp.]
MKKEKVLKEFEKVGALLNGHFVLSSGLHSPMFLQKALVFMHPKSTSKLCKALAKKVAGEIDMDKIDAIVSPAVGGIIPGYETARHLGVPAMYVERENGEFVLRRGFPLTKGMRVLMVEDIVTTGVSSRECIATIKATGARVVAAACLIDRSGGKAKVGVKLISLAQVDIPTYPADKLPPELAALPATKPGSRGLA